MKNKGPPICVTRVHLIVCDNMDAYGGMKVENGDRRRSIHIKIPVL